MNFKIEPSYGMGVKGMFHTWSGTGKTMISLQRNILHRQIIHHWKANYVSFPMICTTWVTVFWVDYYHKDRRIRTGECTSIFGFGSYPPKFSYEIPSKFHQRFPPIFVSRATKFPSFISLRHKISESSDINQDVR